MLTALPSSTQSDHHRQPSSSASPPLPALTSRQITFRVNRLTRMFSLSAEDSRDLRQDVLMHITRAMDRFNPALASRATYCKGVISKWYNEKCTQLRREAVWRKRLEPMPAFDTDKAGFAEPGVGVADEVALRLDIHDAIDRLPANLLPIARDLLCGKSVADIAASLGMHRGSVYRLIEQLREHFAELDPTVN